MDSLEAYFQQYKHYFRACKTNLDRITFFIGKMEANIPEPGNLFPKSDERARQAQGAGNVRFQERKYFEALDLYTASLAWAQTKEVAAFALSNRAAVLARIGRHRECLIDIERALSNGFPEAFKAKLIDRRSEVLELQNRQPSQSTNTDETTEETPNCIEIQTNEKYGRHIVAKRDIEIGELILIERPVATSLTRMEDFYIYCHECSLLCYNLIPCEFCSRMLFCGEECKQRAMATHHKYICSNQTVELMQEAVAIPLRVTVTIMQQLKATGRSGILEEVQKLVVHTEKRPLRVLFFTAASCYSLYKLLQTRSSIFVDFEDMEDTFIEVLMLLHQVVQINGAMINRGEPHADKGTHFVYYAQGLYVIYGLFNHSCFPNVFFHLKGTTLFVRAIASIKKGEQCLICYRDLYCDVPKISRRERLRNSFYFACDCRACVEDWPLEQPYTPLEPYVTSMILAHRRNDQRFIRSLLPTIIDKVKLLEHNAPTEGLMAFRQLIMMSFHTFRNPRDY